MLVVRVVVPLLAEQLGGRRGVRVVRAVCHVLILQQQSDERDVHKSKAKERGLHVRLLINSNSR